MASITDLTAEQLMDVIASALHDGDMEAVASLLLLLAVKDPDSAQVIHDTVKVLSNG